MNNINNNKWESPWKNKIKEYVKKEIEVDKVFKKGETKPDGTVVSSDTGETIKLKVNEIENLLNERDELITDLVTKQTVLKVKKGYLRPFAEVSLQHNELEPTIKEYKDNLTSGKNYTKQYRNFLAPSSSTATDAYRTKGWPKLVDDYTKKKFTPPSTGATPQEYTNLYDINLYSGGGHHQQRIKITEQEVINWITSTLKEFEKIDTTTAGKTFNDYLNSKKPNGVSIEYEVGEDATVVNGYLTTLKTHAEKMVQTADKSKGAIRDEWSFGHNFPDDSGTGMKDTVFGKTEIETFIKFADFIRRNYQWATHKTIKEGILKNTPEKVEMVFIPADETPYTEKELHKWHESYLDEKYKDSSKATNFYKTIHRKDWKTKAVKYELGSSALAEGGLYEWSQLLVWSLNLGKLRENNHLGMEKRLIDSFDNSPYPDIFADLNTMDKLGSFNDRATTPKYYTLHKFPEYAYEAELELHSLKIEKEAILDEVKTGRKDLKTAEKEAEDAKKAVKDKETEIDAVIATEKDKLREQLKTKWGISKDSYTDLKGRIETGDIQWITFIIQKIRYFENQDTEAASSEPNEERAMADLKKINEEVFIKSDSKAKLVSLFYAGEGDDAKKIENWEKTYGSKNDWVIHTLQDLLDGFEEFEKWIKPPKYHEASIKAIKDYTTKQQDNEKPADWQNDPALGADFTDEIINKWKETSKFKSIADVRKLLQEVREVDKTEFKEDFLKWLKDKKFVEGDNTTEKGIENWKALIKKGPKEVITAIEYYKYDKLDNDLKAQEKKKLVWTLEMKGADDKYLDDADLTEEQIKTVLYELAEGKKTKRQEKKADESTGNGNDQTQTPSKGHLEQYWPWYLIGGLAVIGIIAIFWKQIIGQGKGSEEEGEKIETGAEETDEE